MIPRFDLFNEARQPFASARESSEYLKRARDRFSVQNLSYWFLGSSPQMPDRLTWLSTYDQEYMAVYMREYSPLNDPVFDVCFRRLLPLDWHSLRHDLVNGFHLFAHFFHLRMKDVISRRPVTSEFDLSPREREVLAWAADGKTAWETAQLLGVSERAIRLYTENAMNKLRAKTKTQAVAIAVKNDIIH